MPLVVTLARLPAVMGMEDLVAVAATTASSATTAAATTSSGAAASDTNSCRLALLSSALEAGCISSAEFDNFSSMPGT